MSKESKLMESLRDLSEEIENIIDEVAGDRIEVALDELEGQVGTISTILEDYKDV